MQLQIVSGNSLEVEVLLRWGHRAWSKTGNPVAHCCAAQRATSSCFLPQFGVPKAIWLYIYIIVYILTYSIIFIWVCAKIGDAPKWQIQLGKRCVGFGGSYQANPARIKDVVVQRSLVSHASRPQLCICVLMFAGCKPDHVGPVAEAFKAGKLLLHDGLRLANVAAEVPSKLSQILFWQCCPSHYTFNVLAIIGINGHLGFSFVDLYHRVLSHHGSTISHGGDGWRWHSTALLGPLLDARVWGGNDAPRLLVKPHNPRCQLCTFWFGVR